MFTRLTVVIILLYIQILNHYFVMGDYIVLYVNYTAVKIFME